MRIRNLLIAIICVFMPIIAYAQMVSPVKWDIKIEKESDKDGIIIFKASIEPGWHLYSIKLPDGGPVPTSVKWEELKNIELSGSLIAEKPAHKEKDANFDMVLEWWTDDVVLKQNVKFTDPNDYAVSGYVRYMACNDQTCLSPQNEDFNFKNTATVSATAENTKIVSDATADTLAEIANKPSTVSKSDYWKPVEFDENQELVSQKSFWYILR